jgi:hypothetical protein
MLRRTLHVYIACCTGPVARCTACLGPQLGERRKQRPPVQVECQRDRCRGRLPHALSATGMRQAACGRHNERGQAVLAHVRPAVSVLIRSQPMRSLQSLASGARCLSTVETVAPTTLITCYNGLRCCLCDELVPRRARLWSQQWRDALPQAYQHRRHGLYIWLFAAAATDRIRQQPRLHSLHFFQS